jgi:hypothetical protein
MVTTLMIWICQPLFLKHAELHVYVQGPFILSYVALSWALPTPQTILAIISPWELSSI